MKKNTQQVVIGIDLDNTIISYDYAFQIGAQVHGLVQENSNLNKKALRDLIRKKTDGEFEWQKLQGYVYGTGINKARLFPGVYRFLWRCKERNVKVEVVSHKTEFGHFDINKVPLRSAATNFLRNNGLLDKDDPLIQKVSYKNSKKEKIDYINTKQFDYFIDDLEEILFSEELKDQKSILFSRDKITTENNKIFIAKSWDEISYKLFGDWNFSEVKKIANHSFGSKKVINVEKLKGRGNSEIYKLFLRNKDKVALKIYPNQTFHNRLKSEFESAKIFKELKIQNVQRPVSYEKNLECATYEWIDGEKVLEYGVNELKSATFFLRDLNEASNSVQFNHFSFAADACPKGVDIENQIRRRLSQLKDSQKKYAELNHFIVNDFMPIFEKIFVWSKDTWPKNLSFYESIGKNNLILSPSDFGFHNAIRSTNGNLIFHDFEYLGWDDPVKLISDFSHHAAMNLSEELEYFWFNETLNIYGYQILERLTSAWPLYGLNWCLIILNEFRDEIWSRRCAADNTKLLNRSTILEKQLKKSKIKLKIISDSYENKQFC